MPSVSGNPHRDVGSAAGKCPRCGKDRIWKHAKADGSTWRRYCGACHSTNSYRSRQKRKRDYNVQVALRRRTDPKFRAYEIWHNARCRAKARGIEFDIPRGAIEAAVLDGRCQVTGIPFDLTLSSKRTEAFSPSLDRIDPRFGYVSGNVQVVVWIYNRAKGDGTHEDVLKLMEALSAEQVQSAA